MSLRRLELGFTLILAVTIAAKLAAARPPDGGDRRVLAASVAEFLTQRGYSIHMEPRPSGIVVTAINYRCRMTVREYPPEGTFAATIADQARAIGPLRFAYRGSLFAEPPKAGPLAQLFMRRTEQRIGLSPPREPILAIAASPACDVAALPWGRLAALSQ
jgi:hypothetical protein